GSVPCSRSTWCCSGVNVRSAMIQCTLRLMLRRRISIAVTASLLVISALSAAPAAQPDFDQWVERSMRTFDVPGIALSIVKDDAVVVAKGYGVRKLGEPAGVDSHTPFGIASNTKAFTATALG